MWNPFKAIGDLFKALFNRARAFISRAWALAKPFLGQILSETANNIIASLQDLAVEAVSYVATQGLPTDEAKQKAFATYMAEKAKDQVGKLSTSQLNLLREMALAIYKKAIETK